MKFSEANAAILEPDRSGPLKFTPSSGTEALNQATNVANAAAHGDDLDVADLREEFKAFIVHGRTLAYTPPPAAKNEGMRPGNPRNDRDLLTSQPFA
jgi:hypothetical protein